MSKCYIFPSVLKMHLLTEHSGKPLKTEYAYVYMLSA